MGLGIAIKAFIKAWKSPKEAEEFLEDKKPKIEHQDYSHLRLLALMQESGRMIDFLKEDISAYDDAQVGAAVRKIHEDCSKCLEDVVTVRPLMEENEGSTVTILKGYDPSSVKIVGKVVGEPPFTGKLVHKGWKAHKRSLPKKIGDQIVDVICPAEVEVK